MKWSKYVKPYLPFFILGPLCMIVEVLGEVAMPKFLAGIIDYGTGQADIENANAFYKWVYQFCDSQAKTFIIVIMLAMVITAILMMIGGIGGAYFGAKASVNFAADLRADLYRKVQQFSFANIDKFSTGSLVTRLTNDITQMQNFINMLLRLCLRSPGMMIGGIIMAIVVSPKLTACLTIALPAIAVAVVVLTKVALPRFTKQQESIDALNSTVQENITNIRVVKSFVREDFEKEKFGKANGNLKQRAWDAMSVMIMMIPVMTLIMYIISMLIFWFGGNMLISGTLTAGDLTAFVTYVTQILFALVMMAMIFVNFSRALASSKRIREVMEEEIDIKDSEAEGSKDYTVKNGSVEFKNVSFRYYKDSEEKVLDNINLTIPAGKTVGVIGSTGSGKSTLVSMIARLYDADEGEILVDGRNVKDYSLYNLREGVGFVLQKNVLFSGTIEDNLRWGDESADIAAIREMAAYAQADGFVTSFDDGYQTVLDQGGTNVSGGQKQRLCIARALLKRPKILVLDDSTSAVDTATEAKIREAFATELKDSTKIIIAQRISSVKEADMIVVIDNGTITGVGTHDELLANNNEYQEIYYSQVDMKEGV